MPAASRSAPRPSLPAFARTRKHCRNLRGVNAYQLLKHIQDLALWQEEQRVVSLQRRRHAQPARARGQAGRRSSRQGIRGGGRALFADPVLMAGMVASAIIQASHAMVYSFGTLYWTGLGFTGTQVGVFWAVGVVAEVMMFAVSTRVFRHLHPGGMLALGGGAAVLRWLVFPLVHGSVAVIGLQLLHALTFAACHLGVMRLVVIRVPEASAATAQGLYTTMTGIGLALVTVACGPLYLWLGASAFAVMAGFGALGAGLVLMTFGLGPVYPQRAAGAGKTVEPS